MTALRRLEDPAPGSIPDTPLAWLRSLGGPVAVELPGRDAAPARRRAMTTLLHGNEPSGLRALHALLREGRRPAGDLLAIVVGVETALGPPPFSHRALPGHRDLNRCFRPPFEGREAALAGDVLRALRAFAPRGLVDLHNNTGRNPPYGVGPRRDAPHRALTSLFGRAFVHSDLELGALVEASDALCPSVTIECGRAGDAEADAVARRGLAAFADAADPLAADPRGVRVLERPRRVRLRDGLGLAFASGPDPRAALTLRDDLERHNFEAVPAGTPLGWLGAAAPWPLEMRDAAGLDRSRELFAADGDVLRTTRAMVPIMVTTHPEIARSDCLFYVVQEAATQEPSLDAGDAGPAPGAGR